MITKKIIKNCLVCGKRIELSPSQLKQLGRGKYCSRICLGIGLMKKRGWVGKNHPAWKGGVSVDFYQQYRDGKCSLCESKKNLEIHHIDGDRNNAEPSNLTTVCTSCHKKIHHAGDRVKGCWKTLKRDNRGRFIKR